jgi:hypothetical protein
VIGPNSRSSLRPRRKAAAGRDGEVAPVAERGRRQVVDEDVADDAAAQRGDHPERDHTDDVEVRHADGGQGSVEGERKRAAQVEGE